MAVGEYPALGARDGSAGTGRVVRDTEAPAVRLRGGFRTGVGLTQINRREAVIRYRIDQEQLSEFLTRQVRLVERLPVEAAQAAADGYGDGLDDAEREAVWLAAGIATFIGQAIADEPERFIVAVGGHRAV
jgi:hypothetical protein